MIIRILLMSLFTSIFTTSFAKGAPIKQKIIICAEDTGWPPFSIPSNNKKKELKGFNVDLIKYIFKKHKISYEFTIRPWKRCLHDGKVGEVNIVLDAAKNPQRVKDYILTESVYELTPVFFYLKNQNKRYKNPTKVKELKKLPSICGQKGYIYNNFGFEGEEVKLMSKDILYVFDLVIKKRCNIGLARKEVLLTEFKKYNNSHLLSYQEIKNTSKEQFFWLINRNFKFSKKLKKIIDSEIKTLYESGQAFEFLQKYF